jgi:hypothetical protein
MTSVWRSSLLVVRGIFFWLVVRFRAWLLSNTPLEKLRVVEYRGIKKTSEPFGSKRQTKIVINVRSEIPLESLQEMYFDEDRSRPRVQDVRDVLVDDRIVFYRQYGVDPRLEAPSMRRQLK